MPQRARFVDSRHADTGPSDPTVAGRGSRHTLDVLRYLARGGSNRAIAAALCVSEETVKTHVANVLSKLQAENRAQAAVQALKRGLVSSDDVS